MGSLVKPRATQRNPNRENGLEISEEESKYQNHSKSNEINAILDKYSVKPRNLVIIDDSDSDVAAEATPTTQKRALTTKIRSRTRSRTLLNYEDIKPLQIISKVFNNNLQQETNHHQRTHERLSSEGPQTSCPRIRLNFIDDIETLPTGQSRLPILNQYLESRMNTQHISEIINGNDEGRIEKEQERERERERERGNEKGLGELIADCGLESESKSNASISHIDGLEKSISQTNNIQKVSHTENIVVPDANNQNPTFRHISDFDDLENHTSATTTIDDTAVNDAPEQETPDPSKTLNKKWGFAEFRYYKHTRGSQASEVHAAITETSKKMVRPQSGGPKPTNRLANAQYSATPSRNRALQPIILHDEPPYKRQRTEQAASRNGIFDGPNQFEQGTSQDKRPVRQTPTQGQYNNSSYQETGFPAGERYTEVGEYRVVDHLARPGKRHRRPKVNRQSGSQDFSNGNSGFQVEQTANAKRIANSSRLEDPKDPIDIDELQAPTSAFKITPRVEILSHGNAQFLPPKANRTPKLSYLPKSQPSKQISPNSIKRNVLGDVKIEDGSEDELSHGNVPEASNRKQADNSHGKKKIHNEDSDVSYEDDQSLDTTGDIPHTNFGNRGKGSQKLQQLDNGTQYGVQSLFSQSKYWHRPTTPKSCCLVMDQSGNMKLTNDINTIPEFFIKSGSIISLEIGNGSCKLIIHKSREPNPMQDSAIHVEFYSIQVAQTFEESLLDILKNIAIKRVEQSDIDQTFHHAREVLDKRAGRQAVNKRHRVEGQPEDIQLLESNQERRTAQHPYSLEHDNRQSYNDNPLRRKRPKLHQQMHGQLTTKNSGDSKSKVDEIESTDYYEIPSKTNVTRTSLRNADRTKSYKIVPKERTPSPERWTQVNREWVNDWHISVVYPKTGKKTATVDKQDIYRLDNGEFLNDNLIMFYLLWLEQQHPELTRRVYVHNTFFYASLTKTAKGKRGINYEAVERWTAKVDLPSYDYIIVPVNEHTHWYVAIICNAPTLLDPETKEESQSMENGAKSELNREIESGDESKPTTPSKSPQPSPNRSANNIDETEVDSSLRGLSLSNGNKTDTPLYVKPAENLPPSNHGLPTVSSDIDSGNAAASNSATEVIDLIQSSSPSANPNSTAKAKKPPSNRTYDPKQPRIITLDSLAMKHSSTCVNLKDYMVAEIKAKKNISITPPKALGMTAKTQLKDDSTGMYTGTGLPEQGNYCDCGVYLLSYMEEFFERPDSFIEDIIEHKYKVESNRNDTPEFRNKIRNLLFKLQAEQVREAEAAKKVKLAKKSKAAPLRAKVEVEPPNPQMASLSASSRAREQPASDTSTLNLNRNHDNSKEVARIAQHSLPKSKREDVISIQDSQESLEGRFAGTSASNQVKDVENRVIEQQLKPRGCDRGPRQITRTTVESGPSEPLVHLEIRDSFEDEESTQESANHRPITQQQPKRKSPVVDLDTDEAEIGKDQPGTDSQGTGNMIDNAVEYLKSFLPGKKDFVDPTAPKDERFERQSTFKSQKQHTFQTLESPLHSGSNPPRRPENEANQGEAHHLRSRSPEKNISKHSRPRRMGSDDDYRDVNRVDLTEDDPDPMLLDQDNSDFPNVQEIPPSPPAAVPRFSHNGAERFLNKPFYVRDSLEANMIAQSKGEIK